MRMAVFEFGSCGHYASYAEALLGGWQRLRPKGILQFFVTPKFVDSNQHTANTIAAATDTGVGLTVLSVKEEARLGEAKRPERVPWNWLREGPEFGSRSRVEWDIIQCNGRRFGASICLAMEIDHLLPAMASHLRPFAPISGIWFKPTFHYGGFGELDDASRPHEKLLIARALANPGLINLFCLDQFVPPKLQSTSHGSKAVAIVDPLPNVGTPPRNASRNMIGVEPGRHTLLIFGNISARKGTIEILRCMESLPSAQQQRLCVVVAGAPVEIDEARLHELLLGLRRTGIQVIDRLTHIPEADVPVLFAASDTVLAVYRNHPGSSGVILRAALHGRPVLAQNYGLMGKMVRDHRLGTTIKSLDAESLAHGIQTSLEGFVKQQFDPNAAALLAEQHSSSNFSDLILRETLSHILR